MKNKILIAVLLFVKVVTAQFGTTATTWSTPVGGLISNNNLYGYNSVAGVAYNGLSANSETWSILDMNGDTRPDLVVTGALSSNMNVQFSATSNPYWKVYLNTGSGFSTTATNWSTPVGGLISGNDLYGYYNVAGVATSTQSNNSETWNTVDVNGDNKPDLVVSAALNGGYVKQFSPTGNAYWKVYLNTGSGFSTTATNWPTPVGGLISGNDLYGYYNIAGAATSTQSNNSETWNTVDVNGDNKPDLVVSSALNSGYVKQFSPTSNPYWKVYLNTGSGFSTTATNWSTPVGGLISGNDLYGYYNVAGAAFSNQSNNSETWNTVDVNGDNKPDLVVSSALNNGYVKQFSPTGNAYWKVYLNTGSGFSTTATNWSTPVGGLISGNDLYGYNNVAGVAFSNQSNNSETWNTVDVNGDNKPDLVVSAALNGGYVKQFSPTGNAYWKVYLNTGSGFSTTATNWATPVGGLISGNDLYGYNNVAGAANSTQSNNSETWNTLDIDGDNKLDLVVSGSLSNNNNVQFSATSSPYWRVYKNGGATGLNDSEKSIAYALYPNPANDKVLIMFDNDLTKEVTITDITGSVVQSTIKVQQQQTFDISMLPAGIYLVRITQPGASQTVKLFVQQ